MTATIRSCTPSNAQQTFPINCHQLKHIGKDSHVLCDMRMAGPANHVCGNRDLGVGASPNWLPFGLNEELQTSTSLPCCLRLLGNGGEAGRDIRRLLLESRRIALATGRPANALRTARAAGL